MTTPLRYYGRVFAHAWSHTWSFTIRQGLLAAVIAAVAGNLVYARWVDVKLLPILGSSLAGIGLLVVAWFALQLVMSPSRMYSELRRDLEHARDRLTTSERTVSELQRGLLEEQRRRADREEALLLDHVIPNLIGYRTQLEAVFEAVRRAVNRGQVEGTGHQLGQIEELIRCELREHPELFALFKSNLGLRVGNPPSDVQDQREYLDEVERRTQRLQEVIELLHQRRDDLERA